MDLTRPDPTTSGLRPRLVRPPVPPEGPPPLSSRLSASYSASLINVRLFFRHNDGIVPVDLRRKSTLSSLLVAPRPGDPKVGLRPSSWSEHSSDPFPGLAPSSLTSPSSRPQTTTPNSSLTPRQFPPQGQRRTSPPHPVTQGSTVRVWGEMTRGRFPVPTAGDPSRASLCVPRREPSNMRSDLSVAILLTLEVGQSTTLDVTSLCHH